MSRHRRNERNSPIKKEKVTGGLSQKIKKKRRKRISLHPFLAAGSQLQILHPISDRTLTKRPKPLTYLDPIVLRIRRNMQERKRLLNQGHPRGQGSAAQCGSKRRSLPGSRVSRAPSTYCSSPYTSHDCSSQTSDAFEEFMECQYCLLYFPFDRLTKDQTQTYGVGLAKQKATPEAGTN